MAIQLTDTITLTDEVLRAAIIFAGFFILSKLALWIFEKIFSKFAKGTKTKIDDMIIRDTKKPISWLLFFFGIRFALLALTIPEKLFNILLKATDTALILIGALVVGNIINAIIENWGKKWAKKTKSTIDDQLVLLLEKATGVAVVIIAIVIVLGHWGIEVGPLIASLGIGGIAIAFALQSSLGNIFGGMSLVLDQNIKVGDAVWIDDITTGKIVDIGFRSTKIQSFNKETFIVPNGQLADSIFKNLAQPSEEIRVVIPFGVAYGTDIDVVKKLILKEIKAMKLTMKEPAPHIKFMTMADSSINFNAYFYIENYSNKLTASDEANTRIYNALNKAKIEIPFPQMDVNLKK